MLLCDGRYYVMFIFSVIYFNKLAEKNNCSIDGKCTFVNTVISEIFSIMSTFCENSIYLFL